MLGLEALCLGNPWYVGLVCLFVVTGPAEDLQIIGFVCPTEGYGEDVIDVPSLPGLDGYVTRLAGTFPIEEEGEAEGCGEGLTLHVNRPMAGRRRILGCACLIESVDVVMLTCTSLVMLRC